MNLEFFEKMVAYPYYSPEFAATLATQTPAIQQAYQSNDTMSLTAQITDKTDFANEDEVIRLY